MHKIKTMDQRGAVSMITVIFIAIVLTIITTSFIRLAINEQRESTDDDLTTRAFYAAEAGVQDAISAIQKNIENPTGAPIENPNDCLPHGGAGAGVLSDPDELNTEYTCQIINTTPSDYKAKLEEGEAVFFKLESNDPGDLIDKIVLNWHIYADSDQGGDGTNIALRSLSDEDLPQKVNWNDSGSIFPAMLRVQLIRTPNSGPVNRSNIQQSVGFLNPTDSGILLTNFDELDAVTSGVPGLAPSDCNIPGPGNEGQYVCSKEIDLDDGNFNYYIRLQSLYGSTNVRLQGIGVTSNQAVKLLNAQALIDVTGRAADVYRRVEERVNLVPDDLWPNFAILSAEEICKNFVITDDRSEFNAINSFTVNEATSCQGVDRP